MSAASNRLIREFSSWAIALCMVAVSFVYFDEIRAHTRTLLGIDLRHHANSEAVDRPGLVGFGSAGGVVEIPSSINGHFLAQAHINGNAIDVLVDTGATFVALSYEDAERAGIYVGPEDFTGQTQTANGIARFAPVIIDEISIDGVFVHNVRGSVAEPGRLYKTLLGMSFLGKLSRFEVRSGTLVMEQ